MVQTDSGFSLPTPSLAPRLPSAQFRIHFSCLQPIYHFISVPRRRKQTIPSGQHNFSATLCVFHLDKSQFDFALSKSDLCLPSPLPLHVSPFSFHSPLRSALFRRSHSFQARSNAKCDLLQSPIHRCTIC